MSWAGGAGFSLNQKPLHRIHVHTLSPTRPRSNRVGAAARRPELEPTAMLTKACANHLEPGSYRLSGGPFPGFPPLRPGSGVP